MCPSKFGCTSRGSTEAVFLAGAPIFSNVAQVRPCWSCSNLLSTGNVVAHTTSEASNSVVVRGSEHGAVVFLCM